MSASVTPTRDPGEFSLVNGGALFEAWRRMRLAGDGLEFIQRRMFAMAALAWVPLLLLSIADGRAWGGAVTMAFLQDLETHARLLVAVPLLLMWEVKVHRDLPPVVRHFVESGLVTVETRGRFDAAFASALRWRGSVAAELALAALVYAVVIPFIWGDQVAIKVDSWYATVAGEQLQPTLAGWWMGLVGMPMFTFLVLRWALRQLVWTRFLWQLSRLDLALEPAHPDGAAGLHFVSLTERAYRPVLLAFGAVLSGAIASRIFHAGAHLADFKVEVVGTVALLLLAVLGPMLVFVPNLLDARRRGLVAYGTLGQRYAREFSRKWMRAGHDPGEPLVGSADIQSLADLRNGYEGISKIRFVPFDLRNVLILAAITLMPVAPLLLTTFSIDEMLDRVLKSFF